MQSDTHLFHLGEVQGVLVLRAELHEPHVRRLRQLRDALDAGEVLEHGLHGHNRVAVGQRVLLGRVGELLVDDHHVLGQRDTGAQQVVRAATQQVGREGSHGVGERLQWRVGHPPRTRAPRVCLSPDSQALRA